MDLATLAKKLQEIVEEFPEESKEQLTVNYRDSNTRWITSKITDFSVDINANFSDKGNTKSVSINFRFE